MSIEIVILIPAIVVFLYIYLRGFQSVTNTDVLQLVFIVSLFALPVIFVIAGSSGATPLFEEKIQIAPTSILIYLALPLFFVPVSQDTNIRIKAARNLVEARKGMIYGGMLYVLLVSTSVGVGVFMGSSGAVLESPEKVLPVFFDMHLSGFGIAATIAVLAAIVSTLDSFAFDAIVSAGNDLFKPLARKFQINEKNVITLTTFTVFVFALTIAIVYQQILGLILGAMLLYVSIFIPIAIGRALKVNDSLLVFTSIITAAILITCKIVGYAPPVEPLAFVFLHLILLLPAWRLSRT